MKMSSRMPRWLLRLITLRKSLSQIHSSVPRLLVPDKSGGKVTSLRVVNINTSRFKFPSIINRVSEFVQHHFLPSSMASEAEQEASPFAPPSSVRGMKSLDKALFTRTVTVPCVKVPAVQINAVKKILNPYILKMPRIKPVAGLSSEDTQCQSHKLFLLNPLKIKGGEQLSAESREKLAKLGVDSEKLIPHDLEIGYENWRTGDILRAVLPADSDGVSSFSTIGHIAHLNLKPEVLDYRHLIGEIILDKTPSVKTVINKLNTIDNTFRNFHMELLAGENNLITCARENGCVFEMDFSKVYWNPRLSTEHQRVTDVLKSGDVLYDVFAGVGPFAIPAVKKGVTVYANDLNRHSYTALVNNVKVNKVKKTHVLKAYNLDGREFIRTVVKGELFSRLKTRAESAACAAEGDVEVERVADVKSGDLETAGKEVEQAGDEGLLEGAGEKEKGQTGGGESVSIDGKPASKIYITMNLPAMALEFLDAFCGLLSDFPKGLQSEASVVDSLPTVMCYSFSKSQDAEADVRSRAESIMGHALPPDCQVRLVRNVAPNKEMVCVIFTLPPEVLFSAEGRSESVPVGKDEETEDDQPAFKKQRMGEQTP